jgi:Flp pilus assembly protein TadG
MGSMQKHGRARGGRRGQIMVILALVAVGLVGIAALGIDVFYIYWNKNKLQGGTDAAALAGATYLNNVTFPVRTLRAFTQPTRRTRPAPMPLTTAYWRASSPAWSLMQAISR